MLIYTDFTNLFYPIDVCFQYSTNKAYVQYILSTIHTQSAIGAGL